MTETMIVAEVERRIFDRGAVKFGAFKLKLHEKYPAAPLSPIYITLRKPDDGPLIDGDVETIGTAMYEAIKDMFHFDLVAGIPRAGEPFAEVISRLSGKPLLRLGKKLEGDKRKIDSVLSDNYHPGMRVLLVDDLVTQADTKLEAICVCKTAGLVVKDLVVLIDREQGGTEELAKKGYYLHAVLPLSDLLNDYVNQGKITEAKRNEVMSYIRANR